VETDDCCVAAAALCRFFLKTRGKVETYFEKMVGVWVGELTFVGKILVFPTKRDGFVLIFKTFC
jgi:hypothetical protein